MARPAHRCLHHLLPLAALASFLSASASAQSTRPTEPRYLWLQRYDASSAIASRFAPPAGYRRLPAPPGSFAWWLRGLPLKPASSPVLLFDGSPKASQKVHAAVLDLDVGSKDLQQCADSIIRLRAEYLLATAQSSDIHFHFTSGHLASWSKWAQGDRPVISGSSVTWKRTATADNSYASFRRYLDTVFTYSGTRSLAAEVPTAPADSPIDPGDIFVQAGSPGHAVIVLDVAEHPTTHKRAFLLAQGYMPAQQMHILINERQPQLTPWYDADFGDLLLTPEWTFAPTHRHRYATASR